MIAFSITFDNLDEASAAAADQPAMMDEQRFLLLYERTARPLWGYISRVTGDASVADDLLQEVFHRFLRADVPEMNADEEKNYVFRIATNLMRDRWRSLRPLRQLEETESGERVARRIEVKTDIARALSQLGEKDRRILWLAYAEGFSHREIADATGVKEQSVRPMLHRAKTKVADWLRRRGFA